MIVNGSPVEFTQREVLTASVFLQIRASEILSIACKIYALSSNEFSFVRMHNPRRYTDHSLYYNDMIYVNATMLNETHKIRTLIISYSLYVDDAQSIRGLLQSYDRYSEWMDNIESELRSHQRNMQQYYESIALFTGYRKWDMAAFIKAARKYKALAEVVDDGLTNRRDPLAAFVVIIERLLHFLDIDHPIPNIDIDKHRHPARHDDRVRGRYEIKSRDDITRSPGIIIDLNAR